MSDILAEAGFVFKKESDTLVCFHCEVFVNAKEFQTGTDPWVMHIKIYPYCAHVRLCKGDTYILEVLSGANVDHVTGSEDNMESIIDSNIAAFEAVILKLQRRN